MENTLKKREQNLIKEGLFIIDCFEKYTKKNKPDIYKKYLDFIKRNNIFSREWKNNMGLVNYI